MLMNRASASELKKHIFTSANQAPRGGCNRQEIVVDDAQRTTSVVEEETNTTQVSKNESVASQLCKDWVPRHPSDLMLHTARASTAAQVLHRKYKAFERQSVPVPTYLFIIGIVGRLELLRTSRPPNLSLQLVVLFSILGRLLFSPDPSHKLCDPLLSNLELGP